MPERKQESAWYRLTLGDVIGVIVMLLILIAFGEAMLHRDAIFAWITSVFRELLAYLSITIQRG